MDETDDDFKLIRNYLSGDNGSFDIIYNRYKLPLYRYLNDVFNDQNNVTDDIFQQTWLNAIRHMDRYENREKFYAWLVRIAHNLVIDYFRSQQRRGEEELGSDQEDSLMGSDSADPFEQMETKEQENILRRAVAELSPELREVFLLRQENLTFREIAEIQQCSLNTCLARMQYALKNLAAAISTPSSVLPSR